MDPTIHITPHGLQYLFKATPTNLNPTLLSESDLGREGINYNSH